MRTAHPGIEYLMAMPAYAASGAVAVRPGLTRIRALLAALGNPEADLPVIHVAGTNGKGSTCSMIAAILTAHGVRCGLHTSPHLIHAGERMRVDGVAADPEWLGEAVLRHQEVIEQVGASYFEATVALSLLRFKEASVEAAVVEVGLGGRLDATNVLSGRVSAITRIALDHTDLLGDSLADIAAEKAGIIKPGQVVVMGSQEIEAAEVIRRHASSTGARLLEAGLVSQWRDRTLVTPTQQYSDLDIPLAGEHQRGNAAVAVLAAEAFLQSGTEATGGERVVERDKVRLGLQDVSRLSGIRARREVLSEEPFIMLDVAHNPDALVPLLEHFAEETRGCSRRMVALALMRDKDLHPVLEELRRLNLYVVPVGLESPRAASGVEIRGALIESGVRTGRPRNVAGLSSLAASLSPRQALLVTGSHQLVGAYLSR